MEIMTNMSIIADLIDDDQAHAEPIMNAPGKKLGAQEDHTVANCLERGQQ